MKKIYVEIKNQAVAELLSKLALELCQKYGDKACRHVGWLRPTKGATYFAYWPKEGFFLTPYLNGLENKVPLDAMIDFITDFRPVPSVKLNDEYTAIVRDGYVEVGCQKISFDKIKELAKLIK